MDRNSIAELHFSDAKKPNGAANNVLLRLVREDKIQRSTAFTPFCYFGPDVNMKKNSAKVGHFLAILNVYKQLRKQGGLEMFLVEPKYGEKGNVEPDIFCVWKRMPFFIEVQKSVYSEKQMKDKLTRYKALYQSKVIEKEVWQPQDKKLFPNVIILSDTRYALDKYPFTLFQTTLDQFIQSIREKTKPKTPQYTPQQAPTPMKTKDYGGIKINIGKQDGP